jgi:hypothetical protein
MFDSLWKLDFWFDAATSVLPLEGESVLPAVFKLGCGAITIELA